MLLTGDIGGTKTYLALMKITADKLIMVRCDKFPTKEIHSIEDIILNFIQTSLPPGEKVESACFSLAGTIKNNICYFVNLNKSIDLTNIKNALNFIPDIEFCNDAEALANGLSVLPSDKLFELTAMNQARNHQNEENKAIIALGTGLGESFFLKGKYSYPTEGGHTEFAPQSEEELLLWRFLNNKFGHVSYERILSGPGLQNIYEFLTKENKSKTYLSPEEITEKALARSCSFCIQTLDIFVRVLGSEAGNLALKILAYGGIYLGGGIIPKILPLLNTSVFLNSFYYKGRLTSLMKQIPLYAITTDKAALYGCALIICRKSAIDISCVSQS